MEDLYSEKATCFICREKSLPDRDCKICHNIAAYHAKNGTHNANELTGDKDETANVSFPGPGVVLRNHIYGNYVVASRTIEPGELILLEKPITIGPYSPPDMLPICLSCSKDIGLSSKCSKCKWPVCGENCEKFYLHADNECNIFRKCGVKLKGISNEFFSVETLRALLLKDKYPALWERVMAFEPHIDGRSNDYRAKATTDFIITFIREKCQLGEQFSPQVIDHVVGVLSVNTFWALKDLNRYASCLFDKCTLFAHDCDPNTHRKIVLLSYESDCNSNLCQNDNSSDDPNDTSLMALKVTAARKIAAGEMITIRYIDVNQPLAKRREELRETFYFECTCSRCLTEMTEELNQTSLL